MFILHPLVINEPDCRIRSIFACPNLDLSLELDVVYTKHSLNLIDLWSHCLYLNHYTRVASKAGSIIGLGPDSSTYAKALAQHEAHMEHFKDLLANQDRELLKAIKQALGSKYGGLYAPHTYRY